MGQTGGMSSHREHIQDLAAFIEASPSSYHAASEVAERLTEVGWIEQLEADPWDDSPGGHWVIRDGAIIAWWVPDRLTEQSGFRIVGTHTDSPSLKLKPTPTTGAAGWRQAAMEIYGGPLLNSWLDREFALAGRIVTTAGEQVLVRTPAWLRVPQVAPHLDRSIHEGLKLDRQQHMMPVFGVGTGEDLLELVAREAGLGASEIAGHDLFAAVTERPAVFGPRDEFFAASRLDNLSSVHAGLVALLSAEESEDVMVLACFDHEEVGSASRSGAGGPFLEEILRRIALSVGFTGDDWHRALARSSCISADAGHAVHPNYAGLNDPNHWPVVNGGPLLKINANQRYTSDAVSGALWRRACDAAGVPTQDFVGNNSVPSGSTIGPISATRLGIVTVDVGIPLLSMHSARELAGVSDPVWLASALTAYFSGA